MPKQTLLDRIAKAVNVRNKAITRKNSDGIVNALDARIADWRSRQDRWTKEKLEAAEFLSNEWVRRLMNGEIETPTEAIEYINSDLGQGYLSGTGAPLGYDPLLPGRYSERLAEEDLGPWRR